MRQPAGVRDKLGKGLDEKSSRFGSAELECWHCQRREVKPQNVLRGPRGEAKLADYGIVGVSPTGEPVMPCGWYVLHAAPETVAGNGIEARTDIFQSGLTLFRLLTGLGSLEGKFASLGRSAYEAALAGGSLISRRDFPPFIPNSICRAVLTAIDPDPTKRFQSALEMRRALENLSFAGHWTVDATGRLIGSDARHIFRFERGAAVGRNAAFEAFKTNRQSGRETRISHFTRKNLTNAEACKLEVGFLRAVVEGRL
jgi:eukaryotic-like serine/threonine-protein kinase